MNYIKYLADARLINLIYPYGQGFPKKPSKVMLHNSNLMYTIYPGKVERQDVMEAFFVNSLWKDHLVNQGSHEIVLATETGIRSVHGALADGMEIAHFFWRSPAQIRSKYAVGWPNIAAKYGIEPNALLLK